MAGERETSRSLAQTIIFNSEADIFRSQPRHPRATAAGAGQETARRRTGTPDDVVRTAPRGTEQIQRLPTMCKHPFCGQ